MSSYRNQRLTCKGHHTSTMVCIVLHPPNSMLRTNHPSIAADNTFPKSLRNPSNSAKGSDHCHSSDYMKQQWETESYDAAHTDRISHRNPIIISDCNLRTYTSQATRTSFQWQPRTYYTMLQQRRPTWTKRKKFYNLLNTHTSDNIKCHEIHLVRGQFNTKSA